MAPEHFRDYLCALARLQIGPELRGHFEASDIVQQTLLEAHQRLHQFRGRTEGEMRAWLGRALAHNLADEVRKLLADKRHIARRQSLEESSSRLGAFLAADESTPSRKAERNEQVTRLAVALGQLPEPQREVVVQRHLEGRSLTDIARHIGRSEAAVVGLLQRGLKALRGLLQESE
jgi:RNA polymerase sigma-70 factor (ECF subfamily)